MQTIKGTNVKEYACLSTDEKPIAAANGSLLLEMDTFKIYAFDADSSEWIEITAISDNNN